MPQTLITVASAVLVCAKETNQYLYLQYGSKEYWEQRYAHDPNTFEWYQDYAGLRNIIRALIPLDARILQVHALPVTWAFGFD